jgi:DNA-nicking Smr family endonuclease
MLKEAGLTKLTALQAKAKAKAAEAAANRPAPVRPPPTLMPPGPARASLVPPPLTGNQAAKVAGVSTVPLSTGELRMLNDAYAGARPLAPKKARARPREEGTPPAAPRGAMIAEDRADELAARRRLAELVSGGVRFKIRREEDHVEGLRADTSTKLLARIQGKGFTPEATLDLHGLRAAQVGSTLERFIRMHHRRGARHLLLITGKGLHSEDGVSILGPALVDALTVGLAAPWVIAFSSAHAVHGGCGAFAVLLRD